MVSTHTAGSEVAQLSNSRNIRNKQAVGPSLWRKTKWKKETQKCDCLESKRFCLLLPQSDSEDGCTKDTCGCGSYSNDIARTASCVIVKNKVASHPLQFDKSHQQILDWNRSRVQSACSSTTSISLVICKPHALFWCGQIVKGHWHFCVHCKYCSVSGGEEEGRKKKKMFQNVAHCSSHCRYKFHILITVR